MRCTGNIWNRPWLKRSAPVSKLNPKYGDTEKPLVSVCMHIKKYAPHLRQSLDSVYGQAYDNIEIVIYDTSATDESWNIALEYAQKHPGTMTLARNRFDFDKHNEEEKAAGTGRRAKKLENRFRTAAKGTHRLDISPDDVLGPDYIAHFVSVRKHAFKDPGTPLVSVFIYNYNYGRYLRHCFDSVFAQTYRNIEVLFSDNSSTDESWHIALEYARRYPDQMTIMRNRQNMGPQSNSENCYRMARGKYFVLLCSDDAFLPGFVEQCVRVMETNKTAKFTMVHRRIIDAVGNETDEPPFYNQSCIIPGKEQAAVYMMAAVNPSLSQVMYNRELALGHTPTRGLIERWLSYRLMDFNLCFKSDLIYLKEPLVEHRIHSASDTTAIDHSLVEAFIQFVFVQQCAEIARDFNFEKAASRLPQALDKIGSLCLRYCVTMLTEGNEVSAKRYFHLAQAILPAVTETQDYLLIDKLWHSKESEKAQILESLQKSNGGTVRSVSYDPPPGSVHLELKK